uniref:G-protein coupled receptors family 1 profile domain-containing protein n=1 Tax=Xenopus tropicalis TaxID=8364 RepID=A0A1B8XVW7_XENTR
MPNQVLRIMAASTPKYEWSIRYFRIYMTLLPVADIFFYLSSVVNPLLYNISSKQFRAVFLQVLRCRLTIQHVNKERLLKANQISAKNSTASKRPLILSSIRRSLSGRKTKGKTLGTFQAAAACTVPLSSHEAVAACTVPLCSHEAAAACTVPLSSHEATAACTVPQSSHEAAAACTVLLSSHEAGEAGREPKGQRSGSKRWNGLCESEI